MDDGSTKPPPVFDDTMLANSGIDIAALKAELIKPDEKIDLFFRGLVDEAAGSTMVIARAMEIGDINEIGLAGFEVPISDPFGTPALAAAEAVTQLRSMLAKVKADADEQPPVSDEDPADEDPPLETESVASLIGMPDEVIADQPPPAMPPEVMRSTTLQVIEGAIAWAKDLAEQQPSPSADRMLHALREAKHHHGLLPTRS